MIEILSHGKDVLRLIAKHTLAFSHLLIKNRGKLLGHWNNLSPCFLAMDMSHVGLRANTLRVIVINEGWSHTDVALSGNNTRVVISFRIFIIVDEFLIIDLLNEPQLDLLSDLGALFWGAFLIEVITAWSFPFGKSMLLICLRTISWAWALSQLTTKAIRWVAKLVSGGLWWDHETY